MPHRDIDLHTRVIDGDVYVLGTDVLAVTEHRFRAAIKAALKETKNSVQPVEPRNDG